MSAAPPRQGDLVAGRYRVDRVLGAGAMGMVLAATDMKRDVRRALKLMTPGALDDRQAVARFLREARASMALRGKHVTRVYKVDRLESGAPFLVMEYLEGKDLRDVFEARGALPVDEAVLLIQHACEALAEAHALGIVHRDLKPANLFVVTGPGGAPCLKVLDFGVSKILGDAGSSGDTTRADVMIGSPHYMSPEQMRSSRDVDARADVWSLGVIAYQLLTGCLPFDGNGLAQIVAAVLEGQPTPPSALRKGLPPAIDAAVLRCLSAEREQRFPSVVELSDALAPFAPASRRGAEARGGASRPPSGWRWWRRLDPRARRLPTPLLFVLAFGLGCAIAGGLLRLR